MTNNSQYARAVVGRCRVYADLIDFFSSYPHYPPGWLLCYCTITTIVRLLVTEGKVEVTNVGVRVFTGCHVDLEDDTVARRKATGRWVGGTGCRTGQP